MANNEQINTTSMYLVNFNIFISDPTERYSKFIGKLKKSSSKRPFHNNSIVTIGNSATLNSGRKINFDKYGNNSYTENPYEISDVQKDNLLSQNLQSKCKIYFLKYR